MKRAGACLVAIALIFELLSACRTFSYRGVRCSVPGEPCLGGLVCRAVSTEADGGTSFCLEPLDGGSEDADAGADAGADAAADAGADSGADAGVDAGVDAGPDAGVGLDAGQWLTPVLLETDNTGDAGAPAIAVNARGDGIAVWQQVVGGRFGVWANRFDAEDAGWDGPVPLEEQDAGSGAAYPNVAINSGGNAIAVWSAPAGTRKRVRAAWYSPSLANWSDAGIIDADGGELGDAYYPRAVLDPFGNATVAWQQTMSGKDRVWARKFVSDAGWSDGGAIDPAPDANLMDFRIALDGQRNVTVVWSTESQSVLAARRAANAISWGAPVTLEQNTGGPLFAMSVAADKTETAAAIWSRITPDVVKSAWFDSATGSWSAPIEVHHDASVGSAAIGLSGSGNGITVLLANANVVFGRSFSSGIVFPGPHIAISGATSPGTNHYDVRLAMNQRGDAVAVWRGLGGSAGRLFSNRFVAIAGEWLGEVSLVGVEGGYVSEAPAIGIDEDGGAIAVWVEKNSGTRSIWSSRSR